jgi:tetratricopeptide (TPR) repeat protein
MTRRNPVGNPNAARPRAVGGEAVRHALIDAVRRHQAGELDAAAAACQRILNVDPRHPDALHLSGVIAHQRGDDARARTLIEKAIKLSPRNPAYYNTLGVALLGMDRPSAAATAFGRALALDRSHAEAHNNLGNVMMRTNRPAEAEACYRRALAARPGYAVGHNNLGSALRAQGRLDAAEAAYGEALTHAPDYVGAICNLGRVLHEQARYEDALRQFDRALAIDPDHAESHANRAILLLLLGRFAEGWQEYEWRWRVKGFAATGSARTAPDLGRPAWDGSDLAGRTLLVHAEQGLGSAIQFVRYIPLLAARGGRVILECPRPLARLFASIATTTPTTDPGGTDPGTAPGASSVDLVIKGEAFPPFDVQAPLMSLPRIFATGPDAIPAKIPYLGVDPALSEHWGRRLAASPRPRVGLVWAGNPRHENDANRSMPVPALAPVLRRAGIALFSLQVGASAADRAWLGRQIQGKTPVRDLAPDLRDFADTAAVLGHLDLVISVDTAVAHLAGALGRPVWLLLPFVAEWRWMLEREDSPWYPTMRLFRQAAPGDWAELMARVAATVDGITTGITGGITSGMTGGMTGGITGAAP